MSRPLRPLTLAALASACVVVPLVSGCDVLEGPLAPSGRPRVEGSWNVTARALSSTCGLDGHEPFDMSVVQNRDILQFVVHVQGFGPVRYDGWLARNGEFQVAHTTVFASRGLEDHAIVDGRFGSSGRTLTGTEIETITDLRDGSTCRIRWRWTGNR
jgi:hypothetical protein